MDLYFVLNTKEHYVKIKSVKINVRQFLLFNFSRRADFQNIVICKFLYVLVI